MILDGRVVFGVFQCPVEHDVAGRMVAVGNEWSPCLIDNLSLCCGRARIEWNPAHVEGIASGVGLQVYFGPRVGVCTGDSVALPVPISTVIASDFAGGQSRNSKHGCVCGCEFGATAFLCGDNQMIRQVLFHWQCTAIVIA